MKLQPSTSTNLPAAILSLGIILFVWGATQALIGGTSGSSTITNSSTERSLAIEDAIKSGKKTYQYTTNFIPGIGVITDPQAYKQQLEKDLNKNTAN